MAVLGDEILRSVREDPYEDAGHMIAPLVLTPATDPAHPDFLSAAVSGLLRYGGNVRAVDEVELLTCASREGVVAWPVRTVRKLAGAELRWDDYGATLNGTARIVGIKAAGGDFAAVRFTQAPPRAPFPVLRRHGFALVACDESGRLGPAALDDLGALLPLVSSSDWRRRAMVEETVARALC